jgi:8-oxo-dGTP pyrophosphatase MutT (NUDIX family)
MDLSMRRIDIPFCGPFALRTEHDESCAARLIDLINSRANAFDRNPDPGHVTGSAVVVSEDFRMMLMTHHAKLGRWLQLGGHCDGIKDAFFVAKKEAYEESGLNRIESLTAQVMDLDIHAIPASSRDPEHLHYDVRFLFRADARAALQVSAGSRSLRWIPLAELESVTTEVSVLRLRSAIVHCREAVPGAC